MNLSLYASYIFLGLTLAAPIGPVNSARIDKGIKNGFWHAYSVGIGSIVADTIYMALVYFGLVRLLDAEPVQVFLWLFGGFTLIYNGIESIIGANKISLEDTRAKEPIYKSFFSGFLMSISSPLSILFWLGVFGSVLAKTAASYELSDLIGFSAMILLGLNIWDVFVAFLTTGLRRFLTNKSIAVISKLSGVSLVGFGAYFGWQGLIQLFS